MTTILPSRGGQAAHAYGLSSLTGGSRSADGDNANKQSSHSVSRQMPSLASVVSADDTMGASAQASSTINSLLLQIQAMKDASTSEPSSPDEGTEPGEQGQTGAMQGQHRHRGAGEAAAKAFSRIDTNKNGSLSLAEFVAGRPKGMSQDDATKIFKSIDTAGTGSISKDQFAANLKVEHEKALAAEPAKAVDGTETTPDMKALTKDLMLQLKDVIQAFNNGYAGGDDANATADTAGIE